MSLSVGYFVVLQLYLDACLQPANKWVCYLNISCCVTLITLLMWIFWSLAHSHSPFFCWTGKKIEETGARKLMGQNADREITYEAAKQTSLNLINY